MTRARAIGLALALAVSLVAAPASAEDEAGVGVRPLAIVLVGGYGTDLALATAQFGPLRAALTERSPSALVTQFSYTATSFAGCEATPSAYTRQDTAQDIEESKRVLRETLAALQEACGVERVVIIGHSLGGLVAFEALDGLSVPGISDLVTIDSPLGGVPDRLVQTCIDVGFCTEGAVAEYLAQLYPRLPGIAFDNMARVDALAEAGIRVSAWGNESDCFYNVGLCVAFARALMGGIDARETQWLGIPRTVRKDFPVTRSLAGISASHTAVLTRSAAELALDLLP
jgi:pimeloyl-ACP methyl ester carboxylesterase